MNSQGDEFMLVYLDNGTMQLHLLVPPRDGGYKKLQVTTVKKSGFQFSPFFRLDSSPSRSSTDFRFPPTFDGYPPICSISLS